MTRVSVCLYSAKCLLWPQRRFLQKTRCKVRVKINLNQFARAETAYEPVQHGPLRCLIGAITQKIAMHTVSSAGHQYESWQQPRCAVQTCTWHYLAHGTSRGHDVKDYNIHRAIEMFVGRHRQKQFVFTWVARLASQIQSRPKCTEECEGQHGCSLQQEGCPPAQGWCNQAAQYVTCCIPHGYAQVEGGQPGRLALLRCAVICMSKTM